MGNVEAELTLWTARVALAACAGRWAIALWPADTSQRHERLARSLWTVGCALLWVHAACAFQFYHHWSHAEALASTARRTYETTGMTWGGGVYFNYALLLIWMVDVLGWWRDQAGYEDRSRPLALAVEALIAFMAFNAAVVFASGAMRWVAVGVFLILAAGAIRRWRCHR